MRKGLWLLAAGALLGACAPRITAEPLPGVRVNVPVQVPPPASPPQPSQPAGQAQGGVTAPVIKVLPGNPLPPAGSAFVDDFSSYPTGAVLPMVAPDRYGVYKAPNGTLSPAVAETFTPQGGLDKSLRLEAANTAMLTTGAPDWTDYRVSFRFKYETGGTLDVGLFVHGSGDRMLIVRLGWGYTGGVHLIKVAGDQRFTLVSRRELKPLTEALKDQNWHDFAAEARSDGTVRVMVDQQTVIEWKDPDYRAGGIGIGINRLGDRIIWHIDDLKVERL